MGRKINNSFDDEYRSPIQIANDKMKRLKIKKNSSRVNWMIFSGIILIANIALLVLASIALADVVDKYTNWVGTVQQPGTPDFWTTVMPTAGVSVISLLLFILTLAISIYRAKMKASVYLDATERIQYATIQYQSTENKLTEEDFKKLIKKIYKASLTSKTKMSFKKTFYAILVGGDDE